MAAFSRVVADELRAISWQDSRAKMSGDRMGVPAGP